MFAIFGPIIDSKSKQPLFKHTAWKKANNLLREILEGNAADAPNYVPYHQRLDVYGNPKLDENGIALLDCSRGTSDTDRMCP